MTPTFIKPDPEMKKNVASALHTLELAAKGAADYMRWANTPVWVVPKDAAAKMRPAEPGEIIEVGDEYLKP